MSNLTEKFEEEIKKADFSVLELSGFMKSPKLALMAGCAIGYRMACDDIGWQLDVLGEQLNENKGKAIERKGGVGDENF
jgi:hypothetical protein